MSSLFDGLEGLLEDEFQQSSASMEFDDNNDLFDDDIALSGHQFTTPTFSSSSTVSLPKLTNITETSDVSIFDSEEQQPMKSTSTAAAPFASMKQDVHRSASTSAMRSPLSTSTPYSNNSLANATFGNATFGNATFGNNNTLGNNVDRRAALLKSYSTTSIRKRSLATMNSSNDNSFANATFPDMAEALEEPRASVTNFLRQNKLQKNSNMPKSFSTSTMQHRPLMNSGMSYTGNSMMTMSRVSELDNSSSQSSMANATFEQPAPPPRITSVAQFLRQHKEKKQDEMVRSASNAALRAQQRQQHSQTLSAILSTHNLQKTRGHGDGGGVGTLSSSSGSNATWSMQNPPQSKPPNMFLQMQQPSWNKSSGGASNPLLAFGNNKQNTNKNNNSMQPPSSNMSQMQSSLSSTSFAKKGSLSNFSFPTQQKHQPQQQQQQQQHQKDETGNPLDMESDALLHNSCKLYPETFGIVESALQLDPEGVRRRIPISCARITAASTESPLFRSNKDCKLSFPLNIAIFYRADQEIVKLLAAAGPDVLLEPDGPDRCGSLALALQYGTPETMERTVPCLLAVNPICAEVPDRHQNLPLHAAVRHGASVTVLQTVYHAFPSAINQRNFHGETPLDVAIRNVTTRDDVLNFLQRVSYGILEQDAQHLY